MNNNKDKNQLKRYTLLWGTQSLSALGSAMTSYALVLKLYLDSGSALKTALLSVCSYAPYVIMSIFAGTLSDKWDKKKTMLVCDLIAALTTAAVFLLIKADALSTVHLYVLNAVNGLMNTVQQPASEVAATLLTPKKYYKLTSAMRSFSQSLNSILTPVISTAVFTLAGIGAVIAVDLATFAAAFVTLLFFIEIPKLPSDDNGGKSMLKEAKTGLLWLKGSPLILRLILFLACVNLAASAYDAVLPAMVLSRDGGGQTALGTVNACAGAAMLAGSVITAILPSPKNKVRAIILSIFISMTADNFLLAFGKTPLFWCIGAVFGWAVIPYMNANMDVIFRTEIPPQMQGRVFSCRNSLQFVTIPLGFLLGGILTDKVFERIFSKIDKNSPAALLFGSSKGAGAAALFFAIGIASVVICAVFAFALRQQLKKD